jgi:magnesium-transporting ATPase (P-type)
MHVLKHRRQEEQRVAPRAENVTALPLAALQTSLAAPPEGLSAAEARQRLDQYGSNELPEHHVAPLVKLLAAFWGPIPWMIEVAALLSLVIQHWPDFVIILVLLLVNALVGFWEEHQADTTIAALKSQLALEAHVKRDGAWQTIPARELVPGDLIHLRLGEIIPADARLLEGEPLEVDQSALTGESLPVTRQVNENVYSGSILKRGEMDALVYATGQDTYFGTTAHLVETAHTTSHFQRAVLKIGDFLIFLALALVLIILLFALFRGDNLLTTLQFVLVLAVAAIPVAMPTVLSVTMAVGARTLAHKQAVVSRLAAIEELAGIDVLCSDKTGTITQNRLTVGTPVCLAATGPEEVLLAAALASREEGQDPIDLAVLSRLKPGVPPGYQITHFQPFDIAGQVGLGTHILDATVLDQTSGHLTPQRIDTIEQADGFAQVFPEHKFAIVEALQQRGHIVGMTGDGVNDAPALKKADAGIAVSGATDAARAAAAIVLLTPGLSVIIDAIKEGRKTFQHMNSYAIYRITETIRVLLFLTLSILIFNFYPVTPIMIVLLALLNDGAILSIAYDHVRYSDEPERWQMPTILGLATVLGTLGVLETFGLLYLVQTHATCSEMTRCGS